MQVTSIGNGARPQSWKVLSPVEGGRAGKTRWIPVGRAYLNKDGSTNVYLDAYPANGRLQLREWDEEDTRRAQNGRRQEPTQDEIPF